MLGDIYKNNYNPNAIALKFKGTDITYEQLDANVVKFANYLKSIGLKEGERVVLSCPNSPQFLYSYLGTVKTGGIIIPINLLLTLEEISYIVDNSEANTFVIHPLVLLKLKLTKEEIQRVLGVNVVVLDEEFYQMLSGISCEDIQCISNENAFSTFLYTSGTTGKPKAAMLTHKNISSDAQQFGKAIKAVKDDNYICVLPMFHVFAFTTCVILPLLSGATITIHESFQPKEIYESFQKDGITIFTGVPSMYVVLLDKIKSDVKLPNLRLAVSGGAALPVEVLRQSKEVLKLPVVEGYGLSEASPVVTVNPVDGVQKEGSIGLPLCEVECKIFDENDNELGIDQVGELVAKGPNIMVGYYKLEEVTKETLRNGWLHTGDLAKIDKDGYVYIVDRKKDLVISGGLNVYPREVEEAIYLYPTVKEVAVVGVEDRLRGEAVKAYIVLKEGEEGHSKDLLRFLKDHLAQYKLPREIEFVDNLPKNSTGKILKRMLKESNVR